MYKEINFKADGSYEIIDTRDLTLYKQQCIIELKKLYSEKIFKSVPEYKQLNIGIGIILEPEKTNLINKIQELRKKCEYYENKINHSLSCNEIDCILGEIN